MSTTTAASPVKPTAQTQAPRADLRALWLGIGFSFIFTAIIALLGWRFERIDFLPDSGASWYEWQLPVQTTWGRVTAWGFYFAHQFTLWGLIFYAQRNGLRYVKGLHPVNYLALGANALFITLHLLQSHVWYDGLAQDVSIWSSQWSVIFLLVLVLLMENPRRGMFFGKRAPLPRRAVDFVRKYHGYYFAWAIVYTFWYHPMEDTSGHLFGFFYMFLLLLQGSLFFTRVHRNRWWGFTQEFLVLAHGTMVAVSQANGLWPMFFFGFAGLIVLTQMHGLGLSRWLRGLILATYVGGALYVYSERGWAKLEEIVRIPIAEYGVVFLLALLLAGLIWLGERVGKLLTAST